MQRPDRINFPREKQEAAILDGLAASFFQFYRLVMEAALAVRTAIGE